MRKFSRPIGRTLSLPLRLQAALLALCFLLSLSPGAWETFAESGENPPPRITVLGDSISEGYGLPGFVRGSGNPAIASYGNLAAKALGSRYEKEYYNLSVSGDTSADLLALIETRGEELREQDPDLIFLTIGGNDLIHAATDASRKLFGDGGILSSLFSGVPGISEDGAPPAGADGIEGFSSDGAATLEQLSDLRLVGAELRLRIPGITSTFGENLSASILALHTLAPDAEIYVQTIYDPLLCTDRSSYLYTTLSVASSIVSPLLSQMNEVIRALSSTLHYTVVDAASAFEAAGGCPVTNILSFDIHPNEEGHALLAKLVLEAVEKNHPQDSGSADGGTDGDDTNGGGTDGGGTGGSGTSGTGGDADDMPSGEGDRSLPVSGKLPGGDSPTGSHGAGTDPAGASDGRQTRTKVLFCVLLAAVTAAGCTGIVLLYRRRKR